MKLLYPCKTKIYKLYFFSIIVASPLRGAFAKSINRIMTVYVPVSAPGLCRLNGIFMVPSEQQRSNFYQVFQ